MRQAVVRVNPDPEGELELDAVLRVRDALRASGVRVVEADLTRSLPRRREIEIVLVDDEAQQVRERALALTREAMRETGTPGQPVAGAVTFTSAGTPSDALGIMRAFGIAGEIRRAPGEDEESVVLILPPDAFDRVSESRLRTALQSGLNKEVTLTTEWDGPAEPLDDAETASATPPPPPPPPPTPRAAVRPPPPPSRG